jgi:hypothetical protein
MIIEEGDTVIHIFDPLPEDDKVRYLVQKIYGDKMTVLWEDGEGEIAVARNESISYYRLADKELIKGFEIFYDEHNKI